MRITQEQYEQAKAEQKRNEEIICAYHKQSREDFSERWKRFEAGGHPFQASEIRYSAGVRCDTCKKGLAYPTDCAGFHRWDCSGYLLGENEEHASYPFAFYSIISEDQKERAQGQTTRPKE